MDKFNDWWNEKMTNKHQGSDLQFTKLTPDDIAIHDDLYIEELLISGFEMPSGCCGQLYYDYAIKELQKANDLFQKTFE